MKDAIRNNNTIITIKLEAENAEDTIRVTDMKNLTLKHPTDMVCRKSNYMCSRTLMIKADKAAVDLKKG